jgi:hypothetical protein
MATCFGFEIGLLPANQLTNHTGMLKKLQLIVWVNRIVRKPMKLGFPHSGFHHGFLYRGDWALQPR